MRFKDFSNSNFTFPDDELQKVMLICLPIFGAGVLSGSDVPNFIGRVSEVENRSKITITADSKEDAEAIFNGLSVGGTVEMPIDAGPWGTHLGGFRDKFGIEWMVEYAA
jgi:PhnB protein